MCNHTIKVRYQFSSTFTATWYQVKCKLTQNKNTTPPIGCCSSLLYAHMKFDRSLGTDYMELHPSQKVRHIWKTVWLISRMPNPLKNTIKRSKLEQKQPYTVREYVYKSINRHQHFADFSRRKSQSRINDKKNDAPNRKEVRQVSLPKHSFQDEAVPFHNWQTFRKCSSLPQAKN